MTGSIRFASALTTDADIEESLEELRRQIESQIGTNRVDLALTFFTSDFIGKAESLSSRLRRVFDPRVLIGCSAEGIIGSREEIEKGPGISLLAASLPGVAFETTAVGSTELREGFDRSERLFESEAMRLFVMLADPYSTPMEDLLGEFNDAFKGTPVIGGMASGALTPGGNALLLNDTVVTDGVVVVGMSGRFDVDVIVSQGCRPIGPVFRVTDAHDNVITALEGEPPLEQLQDLVGELPTDDRALLRNGIFVGRAIDPDKETLGRGDFLIRGVVGIDEREGALAVGDHIHAGEVVQFHVRDAMTAKEDLEMMLTPHSLFGRPSGAFLFSCNGRGTRLYDHANGDVTAIQHFFPDIRLAGFFCAGEIGPIGGRNFLHGHTASLALIRPKP